MRRAVIAVAGIVLVACASAQAPPNVSFSADLNAQVRMNEAGEARFRWYDDTGNFSRIRLNLLFDNGWSIRFFQKIARIPNDPDVSVVDEVYLERPGDWRIGKQYLPFGTGRILRETGIGGRVDTYLVIADMPISAAVIDNGPTRQRGFTARLGDNIGVSVAAGEHFGINATSFTQLRPPEDAPGLGRGHHLVYGVDVTIAKGGWSSTGEWVHLGDGHTPLDAEEDVVDIVTSYQFPFGPLVEAEGTRALQAGRTNLRFAAQIPVSKRLFLVPSVRFYEAIGWDYAISARVRL